MSFKNKRKSDDININDNKNDFSVGKEDSSVSEFVRRPLPNDEEVQKFEEKLFRESRQEKEDSVKESLSEIYRDDKGDMVNVKKIEKKKKKGLVAWFFFVLFTVLFLGVLAGGVFYYYIHQYSGSNIEVDFSVEGEEYVLANQEFSYKIKYNNPSNADLHNAEIKVRYPDNFVYLESDPDFSYQEVRGDIWEIDKIPRGGSGKIEVKGKLLGAKNSSGVISTEIRYTPSNFSSEFKKEDSFNTKIKETGLDFGVNFYSSVLVEEREEIVIELTPQENNFINDIILNIERPDNMDILGLELDSDSGGSETIVDKISEDSWRVSNIGDQKEEIKIDYEFSEKNLDEEEVKFFFKKEEGDREFKIYQEIISIEVIRSNMDLNLSINDSSEDQAVNFGEELNYSIDYTNKGDGSMRNVMIMVVLNSDFLDWSSLETSDIPSEEGNTLIWSQEQIPQLEELGVGEGGTIDFSIEVSPFTGVDPGKNYKIRSYAQFVTSDNRSLDFADDSEDMDNRSNTIVNLINSDLSLKEELRYFSEDNIPVGTGPLPPKVGEETTFKVYWTIRNNLHELRDTKVTLELPEYIDWVDRKRTSVGSVFYNEEENEVVWEVGRLPLSVYRADAEFSIGFTPEEGDENKIMVISPGGEVEAFDTETESIITHKESPKTTKLEDDEIADRSSDGRIER